MVACFNRNQLAAEGLFSGKYCYVTGQVGDIGRNFQEQPFILLNTGELNGVMCFLSNAKSATNISKGQTIGVFGICTCKQQFVRLEHCDIGPYAQSNRCFSYGIKIRCPQEVADDAADEYNKMIGYSNYDVMTNPSSIPNNQGDSAYYIDNWPTQIRDKSTNIVRRVKLTGFLKYDKIKGATLEDTLIVNE